MEYCCELMKKNLLDIKVPIKFFGKFREFGIYLRDSELAKVNIVYCPWCGTKLPESLRDRYFEVLTENNLNIDDQNLPEEFKTDEWWKKRGL